MVGIRDQNHCSPMSVWQSLGAVRDWIINPITIVIFFTFQVGKFLFTQTELNFSYIAGNQEKLF
jgi:uncharacterized protein (DUF2062 family)